MKVCTIRTPRYVGRPSISMAPRAIEVLAKLFSICRASGEEVAGSSECGKRR